VTLEALKTPIAEETYLVSTEAVVGSVAKIKTLATAETPGTKQTEVK
jgi:hypothetical protein